MKLSIIKYPATPKGKRHVIRNVWGNVNGYVGKRHFWEFGTEFLAEKIAMEWLSGKELTEIFQGE